MTDTPDSPPRTMRAQRLNTTTRTFTVEDVPVPTPGPGEALIKVAYCGICHSDISVIDGTFPGRKAEVIQGHEASGTIAGLGPGVTGWNIGDRVILAAGRPDGTCAECRRGNYNDCPNLKIMGIDFDGGWAEYTTTLAMSLTPVPYDVPMDQAAILADAVATPYGAVVNTAQVQIGESVGVWGLGGVGTHIVQIARLVGAVPIIALDISQPTRTRALQLGADGAFDPTDPGTEQAIRDLTGGRGLDVAFDVVGIPSTFSQARSLVRDGGRLIAVGMTNQDISIGSSHAFGRSRITIKGHFAYRNSDIGTLVKLVSHERLDLSRSVSEIVPLNDIADAIKRIQNHEGNPIRVVVQP